MKYIIILAIMLWGCGSNDTAPALDKIATSTTATAPQTDKQINLTILLDLSDRIDPKKNPAVPEHYQRDSALIGYLTEYFLREMKSKGSYMAKGKMRLIFHPNPPDPGINLAAEKLNIDLSKMDTKGKKTVYDSLGHIVAENIGNIYRSTISQEKWPGSDIWRFFKNDVKEVAIDKDSSYRNILVIFTDGYIYHDDSKDEYGNRYAYILPKLFDRYQLRNNKNWLEQVDKLDFGLISKRSDLDQLEVLVLEISPAPNHKNDEDIISKIMEKWFSEMKVRKSTILNSDLPERTKQKIDNFLQS